MLIKIWNVEELAKVKGLSVSIDNWMMEITYKIDGEEFEKITFSKQESFEAYIKELKKYGVNIKE
ncbi:hypothetical protein [Caloranaerobacter sp. DY30410]|uniref:hypothetical protein n=1 Tax=Caloranaerobacter sp. DY30410 TaxID=3238305 RepID=UPI003D049E5A